MEDKELQGIKDTLQEVSTQIQNISNDAQSAVVEMEHGVGEEIQISPEEQARQDRVVACVRKIVLLNTIMGNNPVYGVLPSEHLKILSAQEKVFLEERNEALAAIHSKYLIEVLDGLADMFVVQTGYQHLNAPIPEELIAEGRFPEQFAGHVGSALMGPEIGALSNSVFAGMADVFHIARIASEQLFIDKLGVSQERYLEGCIRALELICDNNLAKATKDKDVAARWYKKLGKKLVEKEGWHIRATEVNGETWYSLFDGNGKFRKHKDFVGVDLQPVLDYMLEGIDKELIPDQDNAKLLFEQARG